MPLYCTFTFSLTKICNDYNKKRKNLKVRPHQIISFYMIIKYFNRYVCLYKICVYVICIRKIFLFSQIREAGAVSFVEIFVACCLLLLLFTGVLFVGPSLLTCYKIQLLKHVIGYSLPFFFLFISFFFSSLFLPVLLKVKGFKLCIGPQIIFIKIDLFIIININFITINIA